MKKFIFLLFLLPFVAFGQKETSNKANSIIITNKNTAYANFTDVRIKLTKDSIQIVELDKDQFQIKTGHISVKDGATAYFNFDCRDNTITISGMWKSDAEGKSTGDNYIRIEDTGKPDSLTKAAFEKMKALAKKFGTVFTYEYAKYLR
jgi:hypothetical protein